MKRLIAIFTFLVLLLLFLFDWEKDNSKTERKELPLIGTTYDRIQEFSQLDGFKEISGSVVNFDSLPDVDYGLSWLRFERKNIILFEKFIRQENISNFQKVILDTINLSLKDDEYVSWDCLEDSTINSGIIALVKAEHEKEYYENIIKAWKANPASNKIIPISDKVKIKCYNPGFGAD